MARLYLDRMAMLLKIFNLHLDRLLIRNYFRSFGVFGNCDTFWYTGGGEALPHAGEGFLQSREYKTLFSILDSLRQDSDRHYWIECNVME